MEVSNELQGVCDLSPMLNTIVREFEQRVKQLWSFSLHNPDADFAQLEEQARQLSKDCFSSALQTAVHLHRTRIEEGWLLGHKHCECGWITRYKGQQRRTLQTWSGPVTLERGYFYCRRCAKGRYPLDEAMGLQAGAHFSDGLQQGMCLLGVQLPFERAAHTFEVLTDIGTSAREVERVTEERGLALDSQLAQERGQLLSGNFEVKQGSGSCSGSGSDLEGVWAVALDAGRVRYEDGWHDTKAGVVFRAEPTRDEAGEIEGARATHQSYVAEVGTMDRAGERLAGEAWRRGIGPEERVVCIGDGAPSNWIQFDEHFSNRVEVLDWYHAMEHLWQVGNGLFGQGTRNAVEWVKRWEGELWEGRVEGVIMALHREGKGEGAEGEAAREQIHYFETNRERMRYSQYRAEGYPIGSGTVESACKRLIGARLKGGGMCWSKRGAQGVLTLRAELLSNRWEQSWSKTRITKAA